MGTPQAFWQTLLAAKSGLSEVPIGTTSLLDAIFMDVSPEEKALGQTLDIPVPSNVTGQVTTTTTGVGTDPTFNEYNVQTVPLAFNIHLQYGVVIRNFDQFNSPVAIKEVLLDPGIKAIATQANAQIATLLTAGNFNVNPVVSTTGGQITPQQFVNGGFTPLMNQLVNVWDTDMMSFVQAPAVYGNQIQSATWAQENVVGINVAQQAHVLGGIKVAYGARQFADQQMPTTGTAPSQVFTSFYASKFAIAAGMRPLPKGDPRVVDTTYVYWKKLPIKVEFGYNNQKGGYLLNIEAGMGKAVVRPEQGVLFSTAE